MWLLLPTLADLGNLFRWLTRRGSETIPTANADPRLLFLVPAHNEESTLAACLASLKKVDYDADRFAVVVVADNCTDRTAAIARQAGVRCLERTDATLRGKPHALAWALKQIDLGDHDAVSIVDADTEVAPDFARMLAQCGASRAVAVQPYNAVLNRSANALTRMAAVLSAANHLYAFRLKSAAGCNVPLSAGMCLGTEILLQRGWAAFSIGEDWEWYAQLTAAGIPVRSAWKARIAAQETVNLRQSAPQRRRWMLGKVHVLLTVGPAILRSDRISLVQKLDAIAELSQPGPAMHLGIAMLAAVAVGMLGVPAATSLGIALVGSLLRPMSYALLATMRDPQPGRALLAFAYLPAYTVWRLGNAIWGLLTVRDRAWVRTSRAP